MIGVPPDDFVPGQRITTADISSISAHSRAVRLIQGPGVLLDYTPEGTRISALAGPSDQASPQYPQPWDISIRPRQRPENPPADYKDKYCVEFVHCYFWRGGVMYLAAPDACDLPDPTDNPATAYVVADISLEDNTAEVRIADSVDQTGINSAATPKPVYTMPLYAISRPAGSSSWTVVLDLRSVPVLFMYA